MEFRRRQLKSHHQRPGHPHRVALVPGSYNPPTNAHRALIEAALQHVDEVVVLLPRAFPHKSYEDGVSLDDRLCMIEQLSPEPYSIAISDGGLFVEMCHEYLRDAGPAEVHLACGRDAAERFLTWPYQDSDALDRMFENFQMLVAARQGQFAAPFQYRHRIHPLGLDSSHDEVSSTEVRHRIRLGVEWRHLVPEPVAHLVAKLY